MGQITAINRLPEALRNKVLDMLENPGLAQAYIAEQINAEAGKPVLSRSSLNRFVRKRKEVTGRKRGAEAASAEEPLEKIAAALERIADSMEKRYKEPG
jgi:hypothetical protein